MIIIPYGKKGLSDLFYLYKQTKNSNFREYEDSPRLKFYAATENTTKQEAASGAGFMHTIDTTRIKTNAFYDFKKGDKVYSLKERTYYFIENVTIQEDDQSKEMSLKPRKWTILDLSKEE